MEQEITEWPFGIDAAYFKAVKPKGALRYWLRSLSNRVAKEFEIEVSVTFAMGSIEKANVGSSITMDEQSIGLNEMYEETLKLPELSEFDFDKMM